MKIRIGDYVRWKGEALAAESKIDSVGINEDMLPFTDGKPRKVLYTTGYRGKSIRLGIEGIAGGVWSYPPSMIEVIPQKLELPEYGETILAWDIAERFAERKIFIGYIEGALYPVITVSDECEDDFIAGDTFDISHWEYFERIEPKQELNKAEKLEQLRKALEAAQTAFNDYCISENEKN